MLRRNPELDFFDHLEALRRSILFAGGFFLLAAVVIFIFADPIAGFVRRPADHMGVPLYFFRPQEKFLAYVRLALSSSILATVPVAAILAVRFVSPALTRTEKRTLIPAAVAVVVLFAAGASFALLVIVPVALSFFAGFRSGDGIRPLWSIGEYLRIVSSLVYAFCLVFETPIVLLLLLKVGVLRIETLRKYRRHALVLILLLAALVTPPDVVSQVLLAAPLYLLYEGTILAARLLLRTDSRDRQITKESNHG